MLATPITVLALVCLSSAAFAQSPLEGVPDLTEAPYFVVEDVDARLDPLPLREVAVHADISGTVADVTVTQLWENTGATPIAATYVFPLSTRAAVHALEMRVGGRRIVATIKEKEEARKIFEDAKAAGKTTTLLEQSRPNLFTTKVANVMPGEVIEVELSYVELLRPTDGVYSLVVPKVVGPRYVSPSERDPDIPWSAIAITEAQPRPVLHAWPVSVSLFGGVPVQWAHSQTHALSIEEIGVEGAIDIELADDDPEAELGTQDFVLDYALGSDELETGVLVQPDEDGDGGHFLALIAPPARVEPEIVPARDYVFIVDTSGSMGGWPLGVAKQVVGALLDGLDAEDRLNILCFSGGAEQLAPLSIAATAQNKARARSFLDRQHGIGGTELLPALKTALRTPRVDGLARTFVVVTDGYVTVEAEAIDLIRAHRGDASLFAIGVGNGVNRYLLEAIAHAGGGEPYVALDEKNADEIAERLLVDVRMPVLTGVELAFQGFDAFDVEPQAIPTVYASRPLLISGRYRGEATGSLVVTGANGQGRWTSRVAISGGELHPAVPLLWARERIAWLSDFGGAGGDGAPAPDNKQEITALGLEYALVTQHTSFVAVDDAHVGAAPETEPVEIAETETGAMVGHGMGMGAVLAQGSGGIGFKGDGLGGGGGEGFGRIIGMGDIDTGGGIGIKAGLGEKEKKTTTVKLTLNVWNVPGRVPADTAILAVVKRRIAALRACIERASQAPIAQLLAWLVGVGTDGGVTTVRESRGALPAEAAACAKRMLKRLRFPTQPKAQTFRVELRVTTEQ